MARAAPLAVAIVAAAMLSGQDPAAPPGASESRPAGESRAGTRLASARNGSRLVVLIVVDQLSPEVLRGAWPHFGEDGFRRLEREGVTFDECAYDHACTVTAPGHATISTGAPPRVHGIVGNDWIDAATLEPVIVVEDPDSRCLPTGTKGASARALLAPTLADAMKAAFGPASRCASVALKDRSAILMAGEAGDFVLWFDKKAGLLVTSTAFVTSGVEAEVGWLDALNRVRPIESFTDYVWEKVGPAAAYEGLEKDDDPAELLLVGSRSFPHRMRISPALARAAFAELLTLSPAGSEIVWTAARFLAGHAELGKDEIPDVLAIGFSSNDWVGHAFGPDSHEVRDMTLRTDRFVAEILSDLDERVGRGRYNVIVTSDHGVGTTPEVAARRGLDAGRINPIRLKLRIEAAMREKYGPAPEGQHWYANIGDAGVMLNRRLLEAEGISLTEAQGVAAAGAATVSGVAEAIPAHQIADGTLAKSRSPIHAAMLQAFYAPRYADIYVVAKPHHVYGPTTASHGTPYDYDRRVPLFLFGPGIKAGLRSRTPVNPGSGVVTIAEALGIAPPARSEYPSLPEALAGR